MDNQKHCMSIKQAKLIVNAHKHNLLNSLLAADFKRIGTKWSWMTWEGTSWCTALLLVVTCTHCTLWTTILIRFCCLPPFQLLTEESGRQIWTMSQISQSRNPCERVEGVAFIVTEAEMRSVEALSCRNPGSWGRNYRKCRWRGHANITS